MRSVLLFPHPPERTAEDNDDQPDDLVWAKSVHTDRLGAERELPLHLHPDESTN